MSKYASGRTSVAVCDRCGFVFPYADLRREWTGLRVCADCFDPKHPSLTPKRHDLSDPKPLRNPRPDSPYPAYNPADDIENFFPSTSGAREVP